MPDTDRSMGSFIGGSTLKMLKYAEYLSEDIMDHTFATVSKRMPLKS